MSSDESEDNDPLVVVMDCGSCTTKAGFASNKTLSCNIPTVYGVPRDNNQHNGEKGFYVGEEACNKTAQLALTYPVEKGIVTDFDKMEKIWDHLLYEELHIPGEGGWYGRKLARDDEISMVLTEPPLNPTSKHEKLAEVMFEVFGVRSLYVPLHQECALIASGCTTGVVVDAGEGSTDVVVVYEGKVVEESVVHVPFGGSDLTSILSSRLAKCNEGKNFFNEPVDVRGIKHSNIFFSLDVNYEEEWDKLVNSQSLPTHATSKGVAVDFDIACLQCPEFLFTPSQGANMRGMHEAVHTAVQQCPEHMHAELYNNVLLVGGNTMFGGIKERTTRELRRLVPSAMVERVRVMAPPERNKSVWLGGSIMGGVESFLNELFVSKEMYEENGGSVMVASRRKQWPI